MTNLSFQELTQRLEKELYRLHYTEASIVQYRRMWKHIATFFEQEDADYFTEEAGMRFLDEQFNFFELEKAGKLSQSIAAIKARKQTRIPSVWTQDNVTKLLDAIDRGNPAGKRDYAIILLVTRLGLRTIDIKHLRLSDL